MKKRLLLLYHSQSGNTFTLVQQAIAAIDALNEVQLEVKRALDAGIEDLTSCDGLLLFTPEYFGTMSGAVKDFFDRTYYPAIAAELRLPYVLVVCCENEGEGTIRDVQKIAKGCGLKFVTNALVIKDNALSQCTPQLEEYVQGFALGVAGGVV